MNLRVQRSAESFERPFPKKRAASSRTPISTRSNSSVIRRPLAWQAEPLPVEIVEGRFKYEVIVPLSGIDPGKIFVFATPRTLLIESRVRSSVPHQMANTVVKESIDQRISREFSLPNDIEQGGTTVEVCGESLHIAARKSDRPQQTSWSQLIHFDTRASLGSV